MTLTLNELDKLWEGSNLDKNNLKYLCRKYSPQLILSWIGRGLTINNKDMVISFYKEKLIELGVEMLEKPKEIKDDRLFSQDVGDYFT